MSKKARALVRVFGVIFILAALGMYYLSQGDRRREEANWSASAAEVEALQAAAGTTPAEVPETTRPTTTTTPATTEPEKVSTTTRVTATTTTVPPTTTTTIPLPVPPEQVATDEVFGWLEIPRLGLTEIPLLEGNIQDDQVYALDRGSAHWPGTALFGAGGNAVIGGHRTTYMQPFRHLDTMQDGDLIIVHVPWGVYTYSVYRTVLDVPARPGEEADALKQTYLTPQSDRPGEVITLYACNLRDQGGTAYRVLVQADLIQVNGRNV